MPTDSDMLWKRTVEWLKYSGNKKGCKMAYFEIFRPRGRDERGGSGEGGTDRGREARRTVRLSMSTHKAEEQAGKAHNGIANGFGPKTPFLIGVAGGTASGKVRGGEKKRQDRVNKGCLGERREAVVVGQQTVNCFWNFNTFKVKEIDTNGVKNWDIKLRGWHNSHL